MAFQYEPTQRIEIGPDGMPRWVFNRFDPSKNALSQSGVFHPGGAPPMAQERVRSIFGLKVPDRALYGLAGGLSTLQSGNRNEPLGGFFTGLGRGFAGAIGGGQAYAKHEEERQAQQDQAARAAWDQAFRERSQAETERHNRATENRTTAASSPDFQLRIQQLMKLGYSEKDATDLVLNTGKGADAKRQAGGMTAWQQAQIDSYMKVHPGASREEAIAAITFGRPTRVGGERQATDFMGRPLYRDADGNITAEYGPDKTPVMIQYTSDFSEPPTAPKRNIFEMTPQHRQRQPSNPLEGLIR